MYVLIICFLSNIPPPSAPPPIMFSTDNRYTFLFWMLVFICSVWAALLIGTPLYLLLKNNTRIHIRRRTPHPTNPASNVYEDVVSV